MTKVFVYRSDALPEGPTAVAVIMQDSCDDLRHGVRLVSRQPAFATVALAIMAVAIGMVVAAFSVTDAWLFRSLRFPQADRLVVVFAATKARPHEPAVWLPYRTYVAFKDSARSFVSISAVFFQGVTWRTESDAKSLVGMRVTPEFFSTFGVQPLRGRTLSADDASGPPSVVISYGFWRREFGGAETILGAPLVLSDVPHTVVGIMPRDFDVRLLDRPEGAELWTVFRTGDRGYDAGGVGPVSIVARLKDGVHIDQASAEVVTLMRESESAYRFNFNESYVANLTSLQADNARTVRATLLTVLAAALCLLMIAAMNVGVLLLGRALGRRGEIAVRQALGAGRMRLVRQMLAESLVLSAGGAFLGVGLALAATRLFLWWNPIGTLPANAVHIEVRALGVAVLAPLITTIVAGLAPAIRASAAGPAAGLLNGLERGGLVAPSRRTQRSMLVAQMAGSTVLLIGAVLLARTFIELRREPLGFTSDDITVAEVVLPTVPFDSGHARHAFFRALEQQFLSQPGVRAVAAATTPPLVEGPPATVGITAVESSPPRISAQAVTAGYFDTLDIPLIAGRGFDHRDSADDWYRWTCDRPRHDVGARPGASVDALRGSRGRRDVHDGDGSRIDRRRLPRRVGARVQSVARRQRACAAWWLT
jgi:predicted permease